MKVAVAYDNGQIGEHFGHAETFAIFEYVDTVDNYDYGTCCKNYVYLRCTLPACIY